jgi:hypothetical protein
MEALSDDDDAVAEECIEGCKSHFWFFADTFGDLGLSFPNGFVGNPPDHAG